MKLNPDANVDDYISFFPEKTRKMLEELRTLIRKTVPEATEEISYQMPAYKLNGPVVYFAGYDKHIGFYPTGTGIKAFEMELSGYKWSKGAVQFPLDKPLPVDLIVRMVKFKVEENAGKEKKKGK